tara:strand:- start:18 stop:476 length:459 start_codon:yes stop_codon:yes gene_type:complete
MDTKQVYEIGFHILPTVAEEKLGDEVNIIRNAIEKAEGSVISEEFPKMRELTYTMTKHIDTKKVRFDKAYFGWIKFELDVDAVATIKAMADTHENILRYLIIKTVRENTLIVKPQEDEEEKKEESPKEEKKEEKKESSKEEIDKSIDELVIE